MEPHAARQGCFCPGPLSTSKEDYVSCFSPCQVFQGRSNSTMRLGSNSGYPATLNQSTRTQLKQKGRSQCCSRFVRRYQPAAASSWNASRGDLQEITECRVYYLITQLSVFSNIHTRICCESQPRVSMNRCARGETSTYRTYR